MLCVVGMEQAWGSQGLNQSRRVCLAVVGSRNPTAQRLVNAHDFSASLAQSGITIASGLALGIDGAAHEGALDGAAVDLIATIAVVWRTRSRLPQTAPRACPPHSPAWCHFE
jgi:DNA processing protein